MRKVILSLIILLIANTAFAGEFTRANETVTDSTNNLMWQDNAVVKTDKYTWEGAISYCEGLSHAGHDDWRLPTIIELSSIVDIDMFNPTIDGIFSKHSQFRLLVFYHFRSSNNLCLGYGFCRR